MLLLRLVRRAGGRLPRPLVLGLLRPVAAAAAAALHSRGGRSTSSTSSSGAVRSRPLALSALAFSSSSTAPFSSSSSSSSSRKRPPPSTPIKITRSTDRAAFEKLLKEKLDEPLGFLDEGTLQMWRGQGAHVKCLYYAAFGGDGGGKGEEELLGFVTVYEVARDPQGKHRKPHLLNLLYVQPRHRHKGVAVELIRRAASELEVTALCSSDEYEKVCERAGLRKGNSGALAPIVVMSN